MVKKLLVASPASYFVEHGCKEVIPLLSSKEINSILLKVVIQDLC
jgi:hypothetical protein